MRRAVLAAAVVGAGAAAWGLAWAGESREEKVRKDRARVEAAGYWIYNDLAKGFAEATESGKPLVVALRCIPCEECVRLDDDLVDRDARVRPLLEKFVRVRVVSTNGLDLSLFQFDTDQSFCVFLLRADGTVYGRFGTRSDHREWADDVSVEGLAQALEGALEIHAAWPRDRASLARKRGPTPPFPTPEKYPDLAKKYGPTLDEEGKVVASCVHCHMIGDADRAWRLANGGGLPETALFPFPHPKAIGLVLDPRRRATVKRVEPGTPASEAGFRAGDEIRSMGGQPLLSMADAQWVLHGVPAEGGTVETVVARGAETVRATLSLAEGWRRRDDVSWRVSTWELRRRAFGGLKLGPIPKAESGRVRLPRAAIGLRVEHVGQYAPHDVAKRAGFRKDDVLVSFDGRADLPRETDLLRYALNDVKPGSSVPVVVLRDGNETTLTLPVGR
jgi:hypothetical protein